MPKSNAEKEPWLAVNLSRIFVGVGQIYAGELRRGYLLVLFGIVLLCLTIWATVSQICNTIIALGLFLIFLVVSIWSLFDAYKCAEITNSESFKNIRKANKDPWLAIFLSGVFPGLGHFYIKKWPLGIFFIIIYYLISNTESISYPLFLTLGFIFHTFVLYNVYMLSPVKRDISKKVLMVLILLISVTHCSLAFDFIRNNFVEVIRIYGGAMEETFIQNDRALVNKFKFSIKRGDIVVLTPPISSGKKDFIKRVIALENETIEIKNKDVYIDGILLNESYKYLANKEEILVNSDRDNFGPLKIPAGMVFVIGDNRDKSYDSRMFGPVPSSTITGKVFITH